MIPTQDQISCNPLRKPNHSLRKHTLAAFLQRPQNPLTAHTEDRSRISASEATVLSISA